MTTRRSATAPAARRLRGERGSATLWTVSVALLLGLAGLAALAVGQAVIARHRAASAADLAALAAADRAWWGEAAACGRARQVTEAHRVRLTACAIHGGIAELSTALPLVGITGLLPGVPPATARARAGPQQAVPLFGVPPAAPPAGLSPAAPPADLPPDLPAAHIRPAHPAGQAAQPPPRHGSWTRKEPIWSVS